MPAPPLRIALLNPRFWPEVRRGAERLVHDLAGGLTAEGLRPRVVASRAGLPRRAADGYPLTLNPRLPERPLRWVGYHELAGHLPFTYASLRAGTDDVANAFYVTDAVAAARWSSVTGRPAAFTITGIPREDVTRGRRLRFRAWRYATSKCAVVIALSNGAANSLSWLKVTPRVIYPGVNLDTFRRSVERSRSKVIFCPAAISDKRKRVPLLIEALEALREREPGLRLVLAPSARAATARLLPADRSWIDVCPIDCDADLVRAYSNAWVTVLPSRLEAFGLALVESLACGTPVVGADEGGVPEIINRPAVGRLFRPDAVDDLGRAIGEALSLAADPATEAACRERADAFSGRRQVAAYAELYQEMTSTR